jgi:acyl-CoA synthetase (AMP-forming)/AMP-acid ligase II
MFSAGYRMSSDSVVLHAGSLAFNGAYLTMVPAFYCRANYILQPRFDLAELIETVAREQVTQLQLVPFQLIALLEAPTFSPEALQSREMIGSVGAPLALKYKEAIQQALPDRFYELYGQTEGFRIFTKGRERNNLLLELNFTAKDSPSRFKNFFKTAPPIERGVPCQKPASRIYCYCLPLFCSQRVCWPAWPARL